MHNKSIGFLLLAGFLSLATPLTLSSCNGTHTHEDKANSGNDSNDKDKGLAPESLEVGQVLTAKFTEELPGVGTATVTWTFTLESETKATFVVERQTPYSGSGASTPRTSVCTYTKTGADTATFTWETHNMNSHGHDYLHADFATLNMVFETEASGAVPTAHTRLYDTDSGVTITECGPGTFEVQ